MYIILKIYINVLEYICICISYNTGKSALPDIYMHDGQGRVCIYQTKHECLYYNQYVTLPVL